jgi:hypothetical protein
MPKRWPKNVARDLQENDVVERIVTREGQDLSHAKIRRLRQIKCFFRAE